MPKQVLEQIAAFHEAAVHCTSESWHFQYWMARHYEMVTASRKAVLSPPALSNPWNVIV